MSISRQMMIEIAATHGLGGLHTALALVATTHGKSSAASLEQLAAIANMERRTLAAHMTRLVIAGFVKEHRMTRSRRWRGVVQPQDDGVEITRETIEQYGNLGTAFALAALLKGLVGEHREFLISFDVLAEMAACSRDTLDRKFARLEEIGWAERRRVSRSKYRLVVNVPAGTTAKLTEVQRADPLRDTQSKALAVLANLNGNVK